MSAAGADRRGRPLQLLVLLLAGWVGARMVAHALDTAAPPLGLPGVSMPPPAMRGPISQPDRLSRVSGADRIDRIDRATGANPGPHPDRRFIEAAILRPAAGGAGPRLGAAAGQAMPLALLMASAGYLPARAGVMATLQPGSGALRGPDTSVTLPGPVVREPGHSDRWRASAWILARPAGGAAPVAGAASYGGSQWGAVARFVPVAGNGAPSAFLRVTGSLATRDEDEVAIGLSARPLAALPFDAAVELRARSGGEVRAGFGMAGNLPAIALPERFATRGFAQAGFVTGRDATPYFDLALLAQRPLGRLEGGAGIEAGAGLWAGGQRGGARVDVGPHVAVDLPLATGRLRMGVEWRERVAGEAEPGSGPALVLSGDF